MLESEGDGGDGSKNGHDGEEDSKNRFDRNAPELMILEFGFLGFFEGEELVEGKIVAMAVGATIDGDSPGNGLVGDANHGGLTSRADDGR